MVLLGLFLCFSFYASYWIHIMLCKGANLDGKGVTEVTPNQGDPYCPEIF